MRVFTLLGLASVALTSAVLGQAGHSAGAPAAPAINWGPAPAIFPPGAKFAVLQGDPSQAAMFTIRLDLPNGYTFPPNDENLARWKPAGPVTMPVPVLV